MNQVDFKEDILSLSQDGIVHVDFGKFSVTLGNNGLYYLGLSDNVKCIDNCETEEDCHCARMYPNSISFVTASELINFITLNLLNYQAEY